MKKFYKFQLLLPNTAQEIIILNTQNIISFSDLGKMSP